MNFGVSPCSMVHARTSSSTPQAMTFFTCRDVNLARMLVHLTPLLSANFRRTPHTLGQASCQTQRQIERPSSSQAPAALIISDHCTARQEAGCTHAGTHRDRNNYKL